MNGKFFCWRFVTTPVAVLLQWRHDDGAAVLFRNLYLFGVRVAYWTAEVKK